MVLVERFVVLGVLNSEIQDEVAISIFRIWTLRIKDGETSFGDRHRLGRTEIGTARDFEVDAI